jgi:AraC-like DNA-binding protein
VRVIRVPRPARGQGLIAQELPISAAATQAGFSDQSHLTRWFTRCYGVSPVATSAPPPGGAAAPA